MASNAEPDRAEQVALDHQRVEARDALHRVNPVQHQMVPDWGSHGRQASGGQKEGR
ncbi:hypothetical protein [Microvirga sp. G4-2]|uniref:hypothetical protein n=1 Tax=Microvirga sp. G4-2 TaxID=3434467 RepID=UPI0040447B7D